MLELESLVGVFSGIKSIRTRILLPFFIILVFIGVICGMGGYIFLKEEASQRVSVESKVNILRLSSILEHVINRQSFQTQMARHVIERSSGSFRARTRQLRDLFKEEGVLFYSDSDLVPEDILPLVQPHLERYYNNPSHNVALFQEPFSRDFFMVSFSNYMFGNRERTLILSASLEVLMGPLLSQYPKQSFSIVHRPKVGDPVVIQGLFQGKTQSRFISQQVVSLFRSEDVIKSIEIHGTKFICHVEEVVSDLNLFVVFLTPSQLLSGINRTLWIGLLLGIFIIGGWAFILFSLIVRRITMSIDILTSVAQEVANGDLKQRVYIDSSDEMGALAKVFNHMIDSLERASKVLLAEKQQSETIISHLPIGVIVTDMDKRLVLANSIAQEKFNFSMDKVQGKPLLDYINQEDLIRILKEKFRSRRNVISREVEMVSQGKKRLFNVSTTLIKDSHNEDSGLLTLMRDISHEKQLELLREGFLRTVSHELRTPLTSVIGFLELMDIESLSFSDDQKNYIGIALKEAKSLQSLIEDLLDLSRINSGKIQCHYSSVNIFDLLESVVASFSPLVQRKGLDLVLNVSDKSLIIDADEGKLRRIIVNLISNSIKFTEKGLIEVDYKCVDENLNVSIKDTGIGLEKQDYELIFEEFQQVDFSANRKFAGIGLGLSIVKQLVLLHGGRIWVKSTYNEGSLFTFSIPRSRPGVKKGG